MAIIKIYCESIFLALSDTDIWFLTGLQLSLKFEHISGYSGLQSDPTHKRKNPSNPKFWKFKFFCMCY